MRVRQISVASGVHAGNISRILEFLEREHLIDRAGGSVSSVEWLALIKRWSRDVASDRVAESFLEPRGLAVFEKRLDAWEKPYSLTGPYASARIAPAAIPNVCDIYVRDIEEAQVDLELRKSERIGNVRLIRAPDVVAFERTMSVGGTILACPSQIAADLLSLPRRSSAEFDALVEWMQRNENDWRR